MRIPDNLAQSCARISARDPRAAVVALTEYGRSQTVQFAGDAVNMQVRSSDDGVRVGIGDLLSVSHLFAHPTTAEKLTVKVGTVLPVAVSDLAAPIPYIHAAGRLLRENTDPRVHHLATILEACSINGRFIGRKMEYGPDGERLYGCVPRTECGQQIIASVAELAEGSSTVTDLYPTVFAFGSTRNLLPKRFVAAIKRSRQTAGATTTDLTEVSVETADLGLATTFTQEGEITEEKAYKFAQPPYLQISHIKSPVDSYTTLRASGLRRSAQPIPLTELDSAPAVRITKMLSRVVTASTELRQIFKPGNSFSA